MVQIWRYVVILFKFPNVLCQDGFVHLCFICGRIDMVIFFLNLLHFLNTLYQGNQMLRLYIYKLFSVMPFSSNEQASFFLQLHGCACCLVELISLLLYGLIILPTSSLPSHYSYWKFYETCLKVQSADPTIVETSLHHFCTIEIVLDCWNDKLILL